jgi:hypothetical protein
MEIGRSKFSQKIKVKTRIKVEIKVKTRRTLFYNHFINALIYIYQINKRLI